MSFRQFLNENIATISGMIDSCLSDKPIQRQKLLVLADVLEEMSDPKAQWFRNGNFTLTSYRRLKFNQRVMRPTALHIWNELVYFSLPRNNDVYYLKLPVTLNKGFVGEQQGKPNTWALFHNGMPGNRVIHGDLKAYPYDPGVDNKLLWLAALLITFPQEITD